MSEPPVVVMQDAEQFTIDYLQGLLPGLSQLAGYKVGTKVTPGTTPRMFVQVRKIGGDEEQRVAERARIDIRVWDDNQPGSDAARMRNARILLAHMRRDLGCRVMAVPVNLPDPADPTVLHTLFTIEPIIRGSQQ